MKRKMVFALNLPQESIERVQKVIPDWEIIYGKDRSIWSPHLIEAEILVAFIIGADSECLNSEAKLRWIHTWSAGVNRMPLDDLKKRNIRLTNSSGVHSFPLSESVFAMLLAFTRRLHIYIRNQSDKKWIPGENTLELHGKTIGIIGVGAIGKEIAKLAKAFGMKVLGLRRSGEPLIEVDQMYDGRGLNELLKHSDCVILTLPLTTDTYHFMGKKQFQAMKSSAFFVNIGRGETTDTDALIHALEEKQIAGAGLDVFEQEPLPANSPLWEMGNVIITPHTSGHSNEYNARAMDIFIPNLKKYLIDQEPNINLVDFDRQY